MLRARSRRLSKVRPYQVQGPKRAQKVGVERARALLEYQDALWRQGDSEWIHIAREARVSDPEMDRTMGKGKDADRTDTDEGASGDSQEFHGRYGIPYAELAGQGGADWGASGRDGAALEELVYQKGIGYAFPMF